MAKSTANEELRSTYKRALIDLQATLADLSRSGDVGLDFWTGELQQVTARHLAKLGAVQARATVAENIRRVGTVDPLALERDAAILAAQAARKAAREVRRGDAEGWQRLEEAERTIADLRDQLAALQVVDVPMFADTVPF